MQRRRFLHLALGGALALPWAARKMFAAPAPPALVLPPCKDGLEIARRHIQTYCATLSFPSGALHAIRALGRQTPLGPGDPFRLVLESYVVESVVGGSLYLEVPLDNEGHRHLLIMNLLEKGCELDFPFTLQGKSYAFRDVVEGARMLTSYPGKLPIDEHSWTLVSLVQVTPPERSRWRNAFGGTVDLGQMIDDTSSALWQATEKIRTADLARRDLPLDCPVFGYACGGMHMLQALAVSLACGYAAPERRRSFTAHMQTALRRLRYDERLIDSAERQNVQLAGEEAAHAVGFDGRVKFLSHLLEVLRYVDAHRLYDFSAAERLEVKAAFERLCTVVIGSRDMKFERFKTDRFHYESMTTGLCHAYNALAPDPA